MARLGFILKKGSDEAVALLGSLIPWLNHQQHTCVFIDSEAHADGQGQLVSEDELKNWIDLAVVVGGDGTMLRAASLVADAKIPVLGINLGRLGFLTPFSPSIGQKAIEQAIAGQLKTSQRMRLSIKHLSKREQVEEQTALNDAVVHQGSMARLVELSAHINGEFVARYRADGLVIATPTGSTAYNLAAGGPIIAPRHQAMVVTPICAHALTNRPLVIDASCTVTLSPAPGTDGVVVTVDGRWASPVPPGDRIEITAAAQPLLVFESDKTYFDILREKLHWGRVLGDAR